MMSQKRAAILTQAAGNMFEEPKPIEEMRGPRGGLLGYCCGQEQVSVGVRNGMVKDGLLSVDNSVTSRGVLVLQDWLADGGSSQ